MAMVDEGAPSAARDLSSRPLPEPSADTAHPPAAAAGVEGRGILCRSIGRLLRLPAWTWVVAPAVLSVVLSMWDLGRRQLWDDEHATWYAATLPSADFARLIGHMDLVLSPYYRVMQLWIAVFGDSPVSLRTPSLLAVAATAGLLVRLGQRLGGTSVGVAAGVLFAGLPTVSRYAQEARPYAFAMFFATLSTLLVLRAIQRPTWPRWMAYGVCVIALGLSHLAAVLILVAHLALIWYDVRATGVVKLWRWFGALVLVVVVLGPFALYASRQDQAIAWIKLTRSAILTLPQRLFGGALPAVALVALGAIGAGALWWRGERRAPILLGTWALFAPLFTLLTFPMLHLFLARYLLFTVPAWVLVAAAGAKHVVVTLLRPAPVRWAPALAAVLTIALIIGLPAQATVRHDPLDGYPDYRALALTLAGQMRAGDGIAYAGARFNLRRAIAYELRHTVPPRDAFAAQTPAQRGSYTARECAEPVVCLGDTTRLWLVTTATGSNQYAGMPSATVALITSRFTVSSITRFPHVRLVLLTAIPSPPIYVPPRRSRAYPRGLISNHADKP